LWLKLKEKAEELKEQIKSSDTFKDEKEKDKYIDDFFDKFIGDVFIKKAMEESIKINNHLSWMQGSKLSYFPHVWI
jgi:hypothetical protein